MKPTRTLLALPLLALAVVRRQREGPAGQVARVNGRP